MRVNTLLSLDNLQVGLSAAVDEALLLRDGSAHRIHRIKRICAWVESPQGSFLKYTAHEFRKMLLKERSEKLLWYKVDAENKKHEFWQRDSLAIHLYSREKAFQKLKYIHNNPLAEHWQLAKHPCDYKYSSARYYELNEKNFSFLKDLWEVF